MNAKGAIQFLKDHLIECPKGDNCGRCEGAREVVNFIESIEAKSKEEVKDKMKGLKAKIDSAAGNIEF